MIILFLLLSPFPHQLTSGLVLVNSLELTFLYFSLGGLFILLLFSDPVKDSSSGLLFTLMSRNLNSHITHFQFIQGSSHP